MDRIIKFRHWNKTEKSMRENVDDFVLVRENDTYIPLQWTGLTDKFGVEIYEGDIIRDGALLSVVKWDTPFGRWCAAPGTQLPWKQCIVVGNVFENPEININKLAGPTTGQA